ncbi:hypothetical protein IP510_08505 [Psychrobacter sp. NG254]|uniref:hypothetical protein n=1 Tax=Psychrobacter sp. NG254 TaxID=2782003 RepID=UPI0018881C96|nr:hypothetical protein [Psychrobacter sp. NG254]MBF2719919.1 hypothetical protein [Psychrobacter sp. NG254]
MNTSYRQFRSIVGLIMMTSTLAALTGCNSVSPTVNSDSHSKVKSVASTTSTLPAIQSNILGDNVSADTVSADYASADYDKRAQGYDWVGVIVRAESDRQIDIKVRSRSDIKKPTCHFDGKATLMGQDTAHGTIFQATVNDSTAFFQFKDDKLIIDSTDKYALNYFCSGGGSLAGEYKKLAEDLEI